MKHSSFTSKTRKVGAREFYHQYYTYVQSLSLTYWFLALDKIFVIASFIANIKELWGWHPFIENCIEEIDVHRSFDHYQDNRCRIQIPNCLLYLHFHHYSKSTKTSAKTTEIQRLGGDAAAEIVRIIVKWLGKKSDKVANIEDLFKWWAYCIHMIQYQKYVLVMANVNPIRNGIGYFID